MSLDDATPEEWDAVRDNSASRVLDKAKGHMADRAKTYDCKRGERSMGTIVEMFNTLGGADLSEEEGWLFMALVKMVRSQQGEFRMDSYEDGAAYFALAGETAYRVRGKKTNPTKIEEAWRQINNV